jgi:hypothetical protein
MKIDKTFTAKICTGDEHKEGPWTCVLWPESSAFFGTSRSVKVIGTVDGNDFQATFLPWGGGTHMLPLRAALLKTLGKRVGDSVEVHLQERK